MGSEVPNLLQPDARSTLVVSEDVDIAVPVARHGEVKARLSELRGLAPSGEEPSVWLPLDADLIEVNFIGMDPDRESLGETYVLEDGELPLLVFRYLGLLQAAGHGGWSRGSGTATCRAPAGEAGDRPKRRKG